MKQLIEFRHIDPDGKEVILSERLGDPSLTEMLDFFQKILIVMGFSIDADKSLDFVED